MVVMEGALDRVLVRHDEAAEAPLATHDAVLQVTVEAGRCAVDRVATMADA